jgi:hypothetical protein
MRIVDRTERVITDVTTRDGIVGCSRARRIHDEDLSHKS